MRAISDRVGLVLEEPDLLLEPFGLLRPRNQMVVERVDLQERSLLQRRHAFDSLAPPIQRVHAGLARRLLGHRGAGSRETRNLSKMDALLVWRCGGSVKTVVLESQDSTRLHSLHFEYSPKHQVRPGSYASLSTVVARPASEMAAPSSRPVSLVGAGEMGADEDEDVIERGQGEDVAKTVLADDKTAKAKGDAEPELVGDPQRWIGR